MNPEKLEIIENSKIYGNTYLLTIKQSEPLRKSRPGQFVMIFPSDGFEPLLGRPMSIHRVNDKDKTFSVLYHTIGQGTFLISKMGKGDYVKIIGPLGNPIPYNRKSNNFLLIAGGIGIAPLVWLADELINLKKNVVLLIGARDQHNLFPLKKLQHEIEVEVITDDGSEGEKGLVTDKLANYEDWADEICLCGPEVMFESANKIINSFKSYTPAYALFEKEMACGLGICYGCAIKDKKGKSRLICTKGPTFHLAEIYG
ncbi:MAG: dihydroorotate dehydrogenase electron transfer subunit [Dehalococcoidia bacterium]